MLDSSVLLLNHNFEPLTLCSARRAVVLVWSGKAEVIQHSEHAVRSVSVRFPIPAVIRLLVFVRINRGLTIQVTRQNILRRDHRMCQYCGRTEPHMTVDHVTPRSRGGLDTWENLVCACPSCNNRKGDHMPERAGMQLLRTPRKPNLMSFMFASRGPFAEAWKSYLNLF